MFATFVVQTKIYANIGEYLRNKVKDFLLFGVYIFFEMQFL
jgi:hypothetical protein